MQHEAKPSSVFARDPTPNTVFFRISGVNGTLTDLFCFALGGLAVAMDSIYLAGYAEFHRLCYKLQGIRKL